MPDPVNREASSPVDGWRWPGLPWRPRCLGCGAPGEGREDLCGACRARLPWLAAEAISCAPPLRRAVAVFAYAPPVDRWLPRFKFHRDLGRRTTAFGTDVGAAGRLRPARGAAADPVHGARLRARGYDQALELARPLARALALPLRTDLLRRVRATAPQSELDAAARERNLRGAFEARAGTRLPTHVALLDDVLTTGATLHAAAEALHRAGVERIDAWVCARVL